MGFLKIVGFSLAALLLAVVLPPLLLQVNTRVWSVTDPTQLDGTSYDYIVVGSGPAGSVLASTLVREGFRTLLLERGGPDTLTMIGNPVAVPSAFHSLPSDVVRRMKTSPQEGLGGRQADVHLGVVFGGGGSVGWSLFVRASDAIFNTWEKLGSSGWAWDDLTTAWRTAQGSTDMTVAPLSSVSRDILGGAVMAGKEVERHPNRWLMSMAEAFGSLMTTTYAGARSSPVELLRWTLQRQSPFLDMVLNATVARVVIDDDKRATGVEFLWKGQTITVNSYDDIILSAGAVGSPSILLRSGVGPVKVLRKLGVPEKHTLSGVGANLQDHLMVPVAHSMNEKGTSIHSAEGYVAQVLYSMFGEGLKASNLLEVGGITRSSDSVRGVDLEFFGGPLWFVDADGAVLDTKDSTKDGATLLVSLTQPKSRGSLSWNSADVDEYPTINPNYFSQDEDMERLLVGLKLAREIMVNAESDDLIGPEELPGLMVQSDEELMDYIRERAMSMHDLSGTCKMGPAADALAVVDNKLRVHGISGLRVADLSICPTAPNANGMATAAIIGAKAADMIIEQEESPK